MTKTTKRVVPVHTEGSDVKAFALATGARGLVFLGVIESDANPNVEPDAVPLITAQLSKHDAVQLISALMTAGNIKSHELL